ncbi:MAG: hypothetical protein PHF37_08805 [Phycisphaerae bacterium]|nr:hypothetical protein [Phycisphaerae bacterium]
MRNKENDYSNIPQCAADYIRLVVKKMRYRRKVRADVEAELIAHFEDCLRDITDPADREKKSAELIEQFGDAKLLAKLIRRGKKRCRPLWQKIIFKSLMVLGILILYVGLRLGYMAIGTPGSSVDYLAKLNETVRAGRSEELNSQPLYAEAGNALIRSPESIFNAMRKWPGDMNDIERQDVFKWIEDNKRAMELFREASEKPYFWFNYKPDPNLLNTESEIGRPMTQVKDKNVRNANKLKLSIILPMKELSSLRQIAFVVQASIYREAYNSDYEQAISDLISVYEFTWKMQGQGTLVEQLVGIAIEALGHTAVYKLVEETDLPDDQLQRLQKTIEQYQQENKPIISLNVEKLFMYDYLQRGYTDDGRMLMEAIPLVVNDWKDIFEVVLWNFPEKSELKAGIDRFYEQIDELSKIPPDEYDSNTFKIDIKNQFEKIQAPAIEKVGQLNWRLKSDCQAVLAVIGIKRYEKAEGQLPDNLEQVVSAGFLEKLPQDYYCAGPLKYKKTGTDFLLYSCGSDGDDDSGKTGEKMYAEEGDWVFWPREAYKQNTKR